MRFNLSDWALRNRSLVIYFMIIAVIAGVVSYTRLGRAEDPTFVIKTMVVQAAWPGATIEDTLNQVTERLERTLQETEKLDFLRSYTKAGVATIFVNLQGDTTASQVRDIWDEVRRNVADMRHTLPMGIVGPGFNDTFGDTFGIIYGFTADGFGHRELRDYVEDIRSKLLQVPDVSKIEILGAQDEKIFVEFSMQELATLGIDRSALIRALQSQNIVRPGGTIETGDETLSLRVSGAFASEQDVLDVNFAVGDRMLRLSDIARVTRGFSDPPQPLFRVNGKPAIGLAIAMKDGGDILALGRNIKQAMATLKTDLPVGIEPRLVADQAVTVESAISAFMTSLWQAVAIILGVSFISLGMRAGLIIALSIPLTLAIVFAVMDLTGIDMQRISLGALIIALALLVDDAMTMTDATLTRLAQGDSKQEASTFAFRTYAFPMLAGTLVTIAGFVPEPFMNFGFLEADAMVFPSRDGGRVRLPLGEYLEPMRAGGQVVSPRDGPPIPEVGREMERLGIQRPVLTAASSGGSTVGVLVVATRDPGFEFGPRELRLIRLIADIAGPAMANVRAVERERQEAEDQRVLAEVAAVCAREAEPTALVNALHRPLRVLVPRPVVAFGFRDGEEVVYPRGDGTLVRVPMEAYMRMAEELGQIHADELPDDGDRPGILRQMGVHATCTTAVRAAGETVGFLLAGSRLEGYHFGGRERALLRLIAQIVGPAMENARAAMRAREEAEEQRILAEVAALCAREAEADAIITALPAALRDFVPGAVVLDGEIHGDETHYRIPDPLLRDFFGTERVVVPCTPAGFIARDRGQATGIIGDLPGPNPATALDLHAFALTSYYSAGSATSMFLVASRDPAFVFTERHMDLLRKIVQVVGPAIEAARAQQEVARQGELYSLVLAALSEGVILVDQQGEAAFRRLERDACARAAQLAQHVVATGGGALLDAETRAAFLADGLVVCLRADLETILERLGDGAQRPLFGGDRARLSALYAARAPLYDALPHQVETAGRSPEAVAEEIVTLWHTSAS